MKALVVEDDVFYRRRVCEELCDLGVKTVSAGTLEEALAAPLEDIDYLISDVMLPNDPEKSGISDTETRGGSLSGLCLARRMKMKNVRCEVVFLTGAESPILIQEWARKNGATFIAKENAYKELKALLRRIVPDAARRYSSIFIVHGHDETNLAELKAFIQNSLGLPAPVVLREQANSGRLILEKFEDHAEQIDAAFVLLTPDDIGRQASSNDERRRARQNVVFELGFFLGALGRKTGKVIVLNKGLLELPSDIHGLVWISIENGIRAAGEEIRRELTALGLV